MKTYISNTIQRLKIYSKQLDAQSILYGKNWEVFNDTGEKEVFIFRPNSELLISRNGLVQKGKWELLSVNSLLIDVDCKSYLLNTVFADDKFLALQLDGTDGCIMLIESETSKQLFLDTINKVEKYLENKYINPISKVKKKIQVTLTKEEIEAGDKKFKRIVIISLIVIIILFVILGAIQSFV